MSSENLILALRKEAERIEEDSIHSAKGHFNAADAWRCRHYWLGIPATIFGALVATTMVKDYPIAVSFFSVMTAILTALLTVLKPIERASKHQAVGNQYLALKNDARIFREINLLVQDRECHTDKLKALSQRRNELNQGSPEIPRKAFEQARDGITSGEADYKTDKGN